MNGALSILCWILLGASLAGLLHTYILYPISLWLLSLVRRDLRHREIIASDTSLPAVTILLSVYNEERVLPRKIDNFLRLDYPADRLFLMVGSDGSTDGTEGILREAARDPRIRARFFDRGGKAGTVNKLAAEAETEILVFTDANAYFERDAVRKLVRHFADERVGGVCGNLHIVASIGNIGSKGEERYWQVESWLKKQEGSIESTLGATGAIYAIRRSLFIPQPVDRQIADDLLLPLRIAAAGRRVVYDAEAVAYEETANSMLQEFRRKTRIATGTFNVIGVLRSDAPRFSPFVRYAFFSHKLLRWVVPFLLIGLLAGTAGLLLLGAPLLPLLWVQLGFYALALFGLAAEAFRVNFGILSMPLYFMAVNISLLLGWFRLRTRGKSATWTPLQRGPAA